MIFILLAIIINTAYINLILSKKMIYRQEKMYEDYTKERKRIDYAFFGDSHTRDSINPRYIPGSFNFAAAAENYIQTYYKLRKILYRDNVKINNIVLQIDWTALSSSKIEESVRLPDLYLYSKFMTYKEIKEIRNESIIAVYLKSNFPIIGNGEEAYVLIKEPPFRELHLGWFKNKQNFSQMNKTKITEQLYDDYKNKNNYDGMLVEYFIKTIEMAKDNNISVVFIKYPMAREMDKMLSDNNFNLPGYYDKVFNDIDNVLDDYIVLDYYDMFFSYSSDYLQDSEHLNYAGAEILSKRVNKDLKKYKLAS